MAFRSVCDLRLCTRLMAALDLKVFEQDEPYDPDKGILVTYLRVLQGALVGTGVRLNFKYCPFCGTRVTKGAVEDLFVLKPSPQQRTTRVLVAAQ